MRIWAVLFDYIFLLFEIEMDGDGNIPKSNDLFLIFQQQFHTFILKFG